MSFTFVENRYLGSNFGSPAANLFVVVLDYRTLLTVDFYIYIYVAAIAI